MELPVSLAVIEAVQATTSDKIVLLPTSGGSLPLSIVTENLKTVTISVPIANYDNNQHAENENVRLRNLWEGIETFAALMTMAPNPGSVSPGTAGVSPAVNRQRHDMLPAGETPAVPGSKRAQEGTRSGR
jgi:hypothetical protein